ncbi:MAG: hypothetical protein C5B50_28660 [Verrucomicrobia bacterium]|nr:MAG: hypothetical protein C5B50_28660 [Verrucomicrobiota bacterium]
MAVALLARAEPKSSSLACDRELRKTFEAIQAWRRSHGGVYPDYLVPLKVSGLLPLDGAICPDRLSEQKGASTAYSGFSSTADLADPPGTYQYELSAKRKLDTFYLPPNSPPYTFHDVKSVLLSRPFFEQVPVLRCLSHRADRSDGWRNLTVEGNVYWSQVYWATLWLDDVPYCAREANVMFGLKGPPFHTDRAPTLPCALDLRKWACAFGDHAWWWSWPNFEEGANRQRAAHLRGFFHEEHGRTLSLNGTDWWLDGLVQLQGRIQLKGEKYENAWDINVFTSKQTGLDVGRSFKRAAWLQGTVWTASPGETTGSLVWHYAGGVTERAPIVYGRDTARFWADEKQTQTEKELVQPVWRQHETKKEVGKERWLRIYEQEWTNPRPEAVVESLDFVSNTNCRAAPFLIAVNVYP